MTRRKPAGRRHDHRGRSSRVRTSRISRHYRIGRGGGSRHCSAASRPSCGGRVRLSKRRGKPGKRVLIRAVLMVCFRPSPPPLVLGLALGFHAETRHRCDIGGTTPSPPTPCDASLQWLERGGCRGRWKHPRGTGRQAETRPSHSPSGPGRMKGAKGRNKAFPSSPVASRNSLPIAAGRPRRLCASAGRGILLPPLISCHLFRPSRAISTIVCSRPAGRSGPSEQRSGRPRGLNPQLSRGESSLGFCHRVE